MSSTTADLNTSGTVSPSLKLKIRLPGKIKENQVSSSSNASGDTSPIQNGLSTNKSLEDSEENPLKIVIKKSELPQQTGTPCTVALIEVSDLLTERPYFNKACQSASETLGEWTQQDLTSLKAELEDIEDDIKNASTIIESQLDTLETWKQKKNGSGTVTNGRKDITQYFNKRQYDESMNQSLDQEAELSPGDDEVDIMDVVDEESLTEDGRKKKRGPPSKNKLKKNQPGQRGRQKMFPKPGRPSATAVSAPPPPPTPPQPVGLGHSQRISAREKKRNRKSDETLAAEEELDELDNLPAKRGRNTFWHDMEAYFAPLTDNDLKFCAPQNPENDEVITSIPPLGKYYKDVWQEEDGQPLSELARSHSLSNTSKGHSSSESMTEEDNDRFGCGDLTSRILSALIEENIVTQPITQSTGPTSTSASISTSISISTSNVTENGTSTLTNLVESTTSQSIVSQPTMNGTANGIAHLNGKSENGMITLDTSKFLGNFTDSINLPPDAPPTYDYTPAGMYSLEERIKLELRSIGLLDDEDLDTNQREDDEICSELRKIQKQLRDRIISTNDLRLRLYSLVSHGIQKQETDKKERAANEQLERTYGKVRKKKTRPRKGEVT